MVFLEAVTKEHEITIANPERKWVSLDIPLSDFTD
jgi:hypothetical protein